MSNEAAYPTRQPGENRGSKGGVSKRDNKIMRSDVEPKVWELYVQGLQMREIGEQVGLSYTTVSKWIKKEREARIVEINGMSRDYIVVELDRLDTILQLLMRDVSTTVETQLTWEKDEDGKRKWDAVCKHIDRVDVIIVDRILKVQERRAKYLNLDAPQVVEHTSRTLEQLVLASMRPAEPVKVIEVTVVEEVTDGD